MNRQKAIALSIAVSLVVSIRAAAADAPGAPKIGFQAQPFELTAVRLLDGPFKHAQELDRQYLLSLDPERLLHVFRVNAGIPSSAQPLGGWEAPNCELRGHFVGHYLSACGLMYASTGDERLKEKAAAVVAGLAMCQDKLKSGYLSAYPESFIDRVEAVKPVWAPYYTLHKIYAGLQDVYVYCGNQQALDVCKRFADWVIARNARLTDEQMQAMLGNEHGGMNETLANLYGLTGDAKYLAIARRFNHMKVLGPAAKREDRLTGLHANTQIPKFIGAARQYELTGDEWSKTASIFFWETVVKERSYVIGGHSDGEHFSPKEKLSQAFGPSTTETCNTYNMLKLTRHLFCWDPQPQYADYYERALYNHILCSQHPETGMMCYYLPLRAGSQKTYNGPLDSFWCCTGTGVENHAKYGESIYFHDGDKTLFVNLFIASELDWKAKGLKLRQETEYPDKPATRIHITCEKPTALAVSIRRPWWATKDFDLRVNGAKQALASGAPLGSGSYATLSRTWADGDVIDISMPLVLHTEGFRDNPRRFAFLNGPVVLAAEVAPGKPLPAIVAEEGKVLASLRPVEGKPSTFTGPGNVFRVPGDNRGVTLEPLYKIHGERHYEVYFDSFTPAQWQVRESQYRAEMERNKALEARTVNLVNPGEEQNERDHKLKSRHSGHGFFNGRKWRDAAEGWFSWEMKVQGGKPLELRATYWGSNVDRVFDILADGTKIATQELADKHSGEFFDEIYRIPADLTQGKSKITVRFEAHRGSRAGGVFECRVMKAE